MRGIAVSEQELAAGDCAGDEKCPGFDAVRNYGVSGAVETFDTLHADRRSSGAFDLRAHFDEQIGEIRDFRLKGAIFEDGFSFGEDGSGENVFRAGDCDFREAESAAAQALGARFDVAVFDNDFGAELFERLDVQINRARADGTTAGKRNAGVAETRDERAEREHRGAHRLDQFVGGFARARLFRPG